MRRWLSPTQGPARVRAEATRAIVVWEKSVEDVLKRLLQAEARASDEVNKASAERERTIRDALAEGRRAEQQFAEGIPELHQPYLHQAEEHAAQAIAELRKKYEERQRELRAMAEQREQPAAAAAIEILLDPRQN